jgi:phospholipase C
VNHRLRILPLLVGVIATAAYGQCGSTAIKHVIVVFQENRTPDNLFQGLCTANHMRTRMQRHGHRRYLQHRVDLCER